MFQQLVIALVAVQSVLAQFDPSSSPTRCSAGINDSNNWVVNCGPYGDSASGSTSVFTCPASKWITFMSGTLSESSSGLSSLQFQCNDGTTSSHFGKVTADSWTGTVETRIRYVFTNDDPSRVYGIQYGAMQDSFAAFNGNLSSSHARDSSFGCPLISASVTASSTLGIIYSASFRFQCPYCSNGFEIDETRTSCLPCPPGTYKRGQGPRKCTSCPSNTQCVATDFSCLPGYGWNSASSSCNPCTPGVSVKVQTSNDICSPCPQFASNCTTTSVSCLRGYALDTTSFPYRCTSCVTGQTFERDQVCLSCPQNSNCTAAGYQCLPGYEKDPSSDICVMCANGYFKTWQGNDACQPCPSNTLCFSDSPWQCRQGYGFTATTGTCDACPANTYKSSIGNSACNSCPLNAVCSSTNYQCGAGFELNGPFNCQSCPANTFKPSAGNAMCQPCPTGFLCNSTSTVTCQSGFFYNENTQLCFPCPANSFKMLPGPSFCTSCNYASVAFCNSTLMFCKAGFQIENNFCTQCPPGSFKARDDGSRCQLCPSNSQCSPTSFACRISYGFNATTKECYACPSGFYKLTAGNTDCLQCDLTVQNPPEICKPPRTSTSTISNGIAPTTIQTVVPPPPPPPPPVAPPPTPPNDKDNVNPSNFLTLNMNSIIGSAVAFITISTVGIIFLVIRRRRQRSQMIRTETKPSRLSRASKNGINDFAKTQVKIQNTRTMFPSSTKMSDKSRDRSEISKRSQKSRGDLYSRSENDTHMSDLSSISDISASKYQYAMEQSSVFNTTHMSNGTVMSFGTMGYGGTTYMGTEMSNATTVLAIPAFMQVSSTEYALQSDQPIAMGGTARVYLATAISDELRAISSSSQYIIAKKFNAFNHEIQQSLFIQEVSLLYRFSHKYPQLFCQFYGYDEQQSIILTKYYPLKSLYNYLHVAGKQQSQSSLLPTPTNPYPPGFLSKRIIVKFLRDIATAVQIMHRADVAHCDLKTDNVFVDRKGRTTNMANSTYTMKSTMGTTVQLNAVLADFGVARVLQPEHELKVHGFPRVQIAAASVTYASPELLSLIRNDGQGEDRRSNAQIKSSDVYALACLAFEVLNRRPPWKKLFNNS